jgi:outer membrane protein OmpA-like peptidoglycan-associated protein
MGAGRGEKTMKRSYILRSTSAFTVGALITTAVPTFAQSYPYERGTRDSYDRYADQEYDRYDYDREQREEQPYRRQSQTQPQAPYSSRSPDAYGTPFGVSKSTAGAIAGAVLGAGSGAIIGSHKGKAGRGALIGGGLGALGGYIAGRQMDNQDFALDEQDQVLENQRQEIARNRELINELKRKRLDARETERGVVVNLPDVLFEYKKANLTGSAQDKVSYIAKVLKERASNRRVAVEGHADAKGSEMYNQALSQRRAEAVAKELAYSGVADSRLTTRGYGEKYPVAPNTNADGSDNPAGRTKNRRVEVVIEN